MPYNRDRASKLSGSAPFVGVVTEARVIHGNRKIIVRDDVKTDLILLGGGITCVAGSVWVSYTLWLKAQGAPVEFSVWMGGILSGLILLMGMLMIYSTLWYPRVVFVVLRGRLSIHQWRFSPKPFLSFERGEIDGFEFIPESIFEEGPGMEPIPDGLDGADASGQAYSGDEEFILYLITHDGIRVPLCRIHRQEDIRQLAESLSTATGTAVKSPF